MGWRIRVIFSISKLEEYIFSALLTFRSFVVVVVCFFLLFSFFFFFVHSFRISEGVSFKWVELDRITQLAVGCKSVRTMIGTWKCPYVCDRVSISCRIDFVKDYDFDTLEEVMSRRSSIRLRSPTDHSAQCPVSLVSTAPKHETPHQEHHHYFPFTNCWRQAIMQKRR